MASSVVFKVKYEDTLRRFNVLVIGDQRFDLNMEGLRLKICSLFDLASGANFSLVYTDEDNDLVMLGDDEDLHDVLRQGLNPVRITVCLKKDSTSKISDTPNGNSASGGFFMPNSEQNAIPNVAEALKSVPEPLRQAITKISTELTSKAASTSPVLGDLLDGLTKMGQSYLNPRPDCDTTNVSGHAGGHDDPKLKASSEQKVDASTYNKGVKHNDIPTLQQFPKSAQAIKESDFNQPSLSSILHSDDMRANSEQLKKYKEDFESGKYHGCRMPSSSKGGLKKRLSSEKYASRSAALGNTRASLCGHNSSRPYYPFGGECPFSGITPPILTDEEKFGYDYAPSAHALHDSSYKVDGMGSIFHKGVRCDGCGALPITGPRFKSKVRYDYDLCSICFGRMGNDLDYTRIDFPLPHRQPWAFKDIYDPARRIPSFLPPWMARQHPGKQPRSRMDSRFIMDVNVLDGAVMPPSTPFTKIWRMRNNGTLTWQRGLQLLWIGGDRFSPSDSVEIQVPSDGVGIGKELDIAVDFIAPELPGRYISYWRMAESSGHKFGQRVWVLIQVDASTDLTPESFPELNLNLPPESNTEAFSSEVPDVNEPEPTIELPRNLPSIVERRRKIEIEDLNFPINDDLIVTSDVVDPSSAGASSSSSVPVIGTGDNVYCEASSSVSNPDVAANGSLDLPPTAPPNPLYPIIDMHDESSASSAAKNDKCSLEQVHGKNQVEQDLENSQVEETLLKELEEMGFKQIDVNKSVLRENEYDLERSVDELCGVSEWDPILEELKEMGFEDKETNKKLLEKNNGSITRVVMDLIAGEKQ